MLKFIGALCLSLAAQGALAQDSAVANETPAADQASEKAEVDDDRGSQRKKKSSSRHWASRPRSAAN